MTLSAVPDPEDFSSNMLPIIGDIFAQVAHIFGDLTVGQVLEAVEDVPVSDILKAMFQ